MSATLGDVRRAVFGSRGALGRAALRRNPAILLWGLPALLALVYLVAVLVNFGSIITAINMDSDVAIAPVLAKLVGQAPSGSHVVLGNHPYYEEFLFLRATSGLPLYRQLWDVAPMVWSLLGFGVLTWSARTACGTIAAVLTGSALICLGPVGRFSFFALDWHGLTVFHTIVIGAALVWLAQRAERIGWRALAGLAIALGLFSAPPTASDTLFPFWALIPMLVTAAVMTLRSAGRARATVPVFALLVIVTAAVGGAFVAHIMRSNGITAFPFRYTFVTPAGIVNNFELLFEGYMALGGGNFFGMSPSFIGDIVLASGLLVLAAFCLGLAEARRFAVVAGASLQEGQPPSPRLAYACFWATSLVIQSAAFVGTSVPMDALSSRYVLAGYVGIAALMSLLALRGRVWRVLVTIAVSVFAFSSIYQLVRQPFDPGNSFPGPAQANELLRFAQSNDARYGYSGYWDAADLTWLTKFKLDVFPVQPGCGPAGLCEFATIGIDSWYRPRTGVRSMLIADSSLPGIVSIDPRIGRPLATSKIGNLTVAVYPFDIASKF